MVQFLDFDRKTFIVFMNINSIFGFLQNQFQKESSFRDQIWKRKAVTENDNHQIEQSSPTNELAQKRTNMGLTTSRPKAKVLQKEFSELPVQFRKQITSIVRKSKLCLDL